MHPADLFGIRPVSHQAAWRQLTTFITGWFGPLTPECGVPAESLLQAERELGVELPSAVREAYLSFGARLELTEGSCRLSRIEMLGIEDGALVVWFDEDDLAVWGILCEHLHEPDPPVHLGMLSEDRLIEERWRDTGLRFSQLFLERALYMAAEASPYGDFADQGADTRALVERHFVHLDFPDNPYPLPPTRMYAGDGVLIVLEGEESLFLGASSMEGYRRGVGPLADLSWHARTEEDAYRGPYVEQLELQSFCKDLLAACGKEVADRLRDLS